MKLIRILFCAALTLSAAASSLAASPTSDRQKLRDQASHDCYADVQKLCSDVTDDENKVKTCMKANHAKLSPKCAKAFDAGMGK